MYPYRPKQSLLKHQDGRFKMTALITITSPEEIPTHTENNGEFMSYRAN